jgi:hypothetical protein
MDKLNIKLTVDEVNLIMESLGHLPYLRVFELISNIQNQAREQLGSAQQAAPALKTQEAKNGTTAN